MRRPFRDYLKHLPLRSRLLISSLLGTIPLILLGIALLADRYFIRRALILQTNLGYAQLAAASVQGWVTGHQRALNTLANSSEAFSGSSAEFLGLIGRQLHAQPEWSALYLVHPEGRVITRAGIVLRDWAPLQRVLTTRASLVTTVVTSPVTGAQVIALLDPVRIGRQITGVVVVEIRLPTLQHQLTRVPIAVPPNFSLWGQDRQLIARTDTPERLLGRHYSSPALTPVLSGRSATQIARCPVMGGWVLMGYAPVSGTPWTMVSQTPRSQVLAPLTRATIWFLLLSALVLGVSILWSISAASSVARDIARLSQAAQAIGSGHFSTRITLDSGGELAQLAAALNQMADDLAMLDRQKSDLIGLVSHELKTPLTSIHAVVELLAAGSLDPASQQYAEVLVIATRQTHRLQDLIENLLQVARSQAGLLSVTPQPTPLAPLVRAVVNRDAIMARERGVTVTLEVPEALSVLADSPLLKLAMSNLLDNAYKFTPRGGAITVRAIGEPNIVRFTITDTGQGLAPELCDKLFTLFFQAEPLLTRRMGGAGLGLMVVKMIIDAHGGEMIVESPGPGQGSTFGFTLPAATGSSASEAGPVR